LFNYTKLNVITKILATNSCSYRATTATVLCGWQRSSPSRCEQHDTKLTIMRKSSLVITRSNNALHKCHSLLVYMA